MALAVKEAREHYGMTYILFGVSLRVEPHQAAILREEA